MKLFNKIPSRLLLVCSLATAMAPAFSSCSEDALDKVNEDNNNPRNISSRFTLTDVVVSSAFESISGDLNTYFGIYSEHFVGVSNQMYSAEMRTGEPQLASTYNNVWGSLYETLKNARIVANKAEQEGNLATQGMAQVMEALNGALLTDAFGDTPYFEAAPAVLVGGKPEFMTPQLTKQADIYADLHKTLDAAILNLDKGDKSKPGAQDFLYAGDAAKWKKFAYALKARLTMQTLFRASDKTAELNKVLSYVAQSFTSPAEAAIVNIYSTTNLNPFFSIQKSRESLAASQSFATKLTERNDPRLSRFFVAPRQSDNEGKQVVGAADPFFKPSPNGAPESASSQGVYMEPVASYAQTGNSYLFSYHELLFLKAEAHARLGQRAEAEASLKQALAAAFAALESDVSAALRASQVSFTTTTTALTANDATNYFDTQLATRFATNPLAEVMVQKYLATLNAGGESVIAYNDIRRMRALGENFVTLAHTGRFPLRATYGSGDTSTNVNVRTAYGDGTYVYSENVWWAGGSR